MATAGLHLDAVPRRNLFFRTNLFPAFWRAEKNDGYYNTFNALIRRPETQSKGRGFVDLQEASKNMANQWDFGIAWLPTHHLLIYGIYLRFNAGQFFADTQTAPKDNMNGVMVLTQFTF